MTYRLCELEGQSDLIVTKWHGLYDVNLVSLLVHTLCTAGLIHNSYYLGVIVSLSLYPGSPSND